MIAQTGDTPRRFKVGDSISQGVTLASVERLHVTLLRNGRRESLHFPDKNPGGRVDSNIQPSAGPLKPPITQL